MVVQPWRMRDENPSEANASERRAGFERRNIVHHDVFIESKCRRRHFSEQHRLSGASPFPHPPPSNHLHGWFLVLQRITSLVPPE